MGHLLIHCRWLPTLWHLSPSLMSVSWAQTSLVKEVVVAYGTRMKNCVVSCSGDDSFAHLVVYLVRKESRDVLGQRFVPSNLQALLLEIFL